MDCPFCKREKLEDRVFYEDDNWIAFLAAPYHTNGHCILAAKPIKRDRYPVCPIVDVVGWRILEHIDAALVSVTDSLMKHYHPKDILFSSVRGDINHFHCHLIPLWDNEEKIWRKEHLYERGHLLEYLGYLEKRGTRLQNVSVRKWVGTQSTSKMPSPRNCGPMSKFSDYSLATVRLKNLDGELC